MKSSPVLCAAALLLAACSANGPQFSGLTPPAAGMGKVYVYRPSAFVGKGGGYDVQADGKMLGYLRNNGHLVAELPAGEHEITAQTEVRRTVRLALQEGEIRCVKAGITVGVFAPHPKLAEVPLEQCKAEIAAIRESYKFPNSRSN